jgi:hypothetical protein
MAQPTVGFGEGVAAGALGLGAGAMALKKGGMGRLLHRTPASVSKMTNTALLRSEADQVAKTMSRLSKKELTALNNSKLVQSGMPAERAYQLASRSLSPGEDLVGFLSKNASGFGAAFLEKLGMIPIGTTPPQPNNQAQKLLEKSQKVGTPDDPKGPAYKPLHMMKPKTPGTPDSSSSYSSPVKFGSVARDFFAKLAFNTSVYSGPGWPGRFRQTSGVRPIGEGVAPASSFDERLAGNAHEESPPKSKKLEKKAFRGSGYGDASSHGAWSGNGGRHASVLAFKPIPAASVLDPHIKSGGESDDLVERAKKALMVKKSLA